MAKEGKKKSAVETGKRKEAVARASVEEGKGRVVINSKPLEIWGTEPLQLWIKEPLMLAGDAVNNLNISVGVKGGGIVGQAQAVRVAISKALVKFLKDAKLRERYLAYDRNLLVYDPRQTEPHKPSRSKQGARRHKQRSKR
jgi:small subunit ribosomal protein S9